MAEQVGNPEEDQQFIEYVVKSLVDQPDKVSTERTIDEMGVLITLSVAQEDLGQVIGRQGQTAKALRTLLRVVGAKHHARVNLKIYEPEGHRKNKPEGRDMRSEAPATEEVDTSTVDDLKI
ncbi:MAG: RNA-binding protein [Candidatus Kerfeldbacteria bacterium CG08_land_8_20_14_0_20_42_7]|uniref:RNA-binding protein KhpA n=1 Tax=Candidatus Kerfeldbacteria bacterium CG08_land_8_20_14_0_20_42_7 TaxID=2014245 RepID=A0A2H0YTG9_9BACT|nr:MAG: RNA-binding protein [Candidatus Kerfeldbacteria bacterium CG08_land_8_20_14_0_20_42_7]